jgi:predicted RNA-binding Zn ribbon-like protein
MAHDRNARVVVESPYSLEALLAVASSAHGPEGHFDLPTTGVPAGPDHDHLADTEAARAWLGLRRELAVPAAAPEAATLATLRSIREAVHLLARKRRAQYARRTDVLLKRTAYRLTGGLGLSSLGGGWDALAAGLLVPLAQLDGVRTRLHFCANPRCRWLFLDDSDSHTRRWCDAAACGNRVKVRRHRARARLLR